jgi:hypothetical protein
MTDRSNLETVSQDSNGLDEGLNGGADGVSAGQPKEQVVDNKTVPSDSGQVKTILLDSVGGTPFDPPPPSPADPARSCPEDGVWAVRMVGPGTASGFCLELVAGTVVGFFNSCNRLAGNALTGPAKLVIEDGLCRTELKLSSGASLSLSAERLTDQFYTVTLTNPTSGQMSGAQMLRASLVDGPG